MSPDTFTVTVGIVSTAIALGALVVAVLAHRKQSGFSAEQNRLSAEQNRLSARQTEIAEGQLALQAGMALKDAIMFCVRDLEKRGQKGKAHKVSLIVFDWAHNHGSSLTYVDRLRDRIYRACGVDINTLIPDDLKDAVPVK